MTVIVMTTTKLTTALFDYGCLMNRRRTSDVNPTGNIAKQQCN